MLLVQILGGLFGIGVAYAMDYFLVTRPMKKEEEKVRQELLEKRVPQDTKAPRRRQTI
jgi:hypothetical protein